MPDSRPVCPPVRATRRGLAVLQAGSVDVDEIQPVIQRLGEGVRGDSSQEHAARARNHSDASAARPFEFAQLTKRVVFQAQE